MTPRDALIVSTARTPIARAARGALNDTRGAALGAHVLQHALQRAGGIDPLQVQDVMLGCAWQEGTTGNNVARQSLLRAGWPDSVAAATVDRKCASGLQAIVQQALRIRSGEAEVLGAGGLESVSLVQNHRATYRARDEWLAKKKGGDLRIDDRHRGDRRVALWHRPRSAGRIRPAQPVARVAGHGGRQV